MCVIIGALDDGEAELYGELCLARGERDRLKSTLQSALAIIRQQQEALKRCFGPTGDGARSSIRQEALATAQIFLDQHDKQS